MPLKFNVSFEDPTAAYTSYYALLTSNILAAGQLWAEYLVSEASIEIKVSFEDRETGTAAGGPSTSKYIRTYEGVNIYQIGTVDEILTGIDTNGSDASDAVIIIDPDYLANELWLNPNPSDRTGTIPRGKTDAISVFMHEIGHGFGFNGWADDYTGKLPGYGSIYDSLIVVGQDLAYFNGANALAVYGGPVPLTFGNLHHYGNEEPAAGSELTVDGLMNGVVTYRGTRYDISPLDIAFLKDVGLPVNNFVGFRQDDNLVGDAFDNLFKGLWGNDTLAGGPGYDTAAYVGASANYVVTYNAANASYSVRDTVSARDGTDVLSSIEYLQFSDVTQAPAYFVQQGVPTYVLTSGALAVNEGGANVYTLTTTNVAAGTVLQYSLSGVSAADVVGGALTRSITVAGSGSTLFTVGLVADRLNEGAELMVAQVESTTGARLATAPTVRVNDTSVIAVAGGSAESVVARVHQALYGQAPAFATYSSAVAKIGPVDNGFDWANSEAAALAQLSNSAFSTLVLNHISITSTSLLPTVLFGNSQQVYSALQSELTNYLALVGMGNRGIVVTQLTQILASYEGETLYGVYGPAATAFVKQVTANIYYSIDPTHTQAMSVPVPAAANATLAGNWVEAELIGQSSVQQGALPAWEDFYLA